MCGLGAILFGPAGAPERRARLTALGRALAHRGPDGEGLHLRGPAGLCHRRLAILDPAAGQQPWSDAQGRWWVVFNGEIYNHLELREELPGPWRSLCDTETLLRAWRIWGEAALERLEGMFAFVIWDALTETAWAARDRLGVKPLVWARRGEEVLLASQVSGLLAAGLAPRLDEEALATTLVAPAFSGARRSLFHGVHILPAGSLLRLRAGETRQRRWFQLRLGARSAPERPEEELIAELRQALEQATRRALLADVPLGVFLSGGLDSSALTVLAHASALLSEGRAAPLSAWTIRFEEHGDIDFGDSTIVVSDDAPWSELLAERLGLPLTPVVADRDFIMRALPALGRINDRLPAWEQELAQHALSAAVARAGRKVVLVGDAADETHYGYWFLLDEEVSRSPESLMSLFGAETRAACLDPALRRRTRPLAALSAALRALAAEAGLSWSADPLERRAATSHLVAELWLGRLLHNGDVHTMAWGVEARVPFADGDLLAVASAVKPSQGYRPGREKRLLREALRGVLPEGIIERRKSALPRDPRLGQRYQQELSRMLDAEPERLAGWFDRAALTRLSRLPAPSDAERTLLFNILTAASFRSHWFG